MLTKDAVPITKNTLLTLGLTLIACPSFTGIQKKAIWSSLHDEALNDTVNSYVSKRYLVIKWTIMEIWLLLWKRWNTVTSLRY